jgi:hypothetical protein
VSWDRSQEVVTPPTPSMTEGDHFVGALSWRHGGDHVGEHLLTSDGMDLADIYLLMLDRVIGHRL